MKKIAILTFHTAINYGAALQSVALFKTILNYNENSFIINYINSKFEKDYRIYTFGVHKTLKNVVWNLLNVPQKIKRKRYFKKFLKMNTKLSRRCNTQNIASMNADVFIVGSDQIWNTVCTGEDKTYFLDFVKNGEKASYAASFGDAVIEDNYKQKYSSLMSDFDNISVRENSGIEIVKNVCGKDCVQVLDPTLLLTSNEWTAIAKKKRKYHFNYVLVYFMANNPEITKEMMDVVFRVKNEKNLEIVIIGGSLKNKREGIYYDKAFSPADFISLFENASFVITNSFHGTAFSYIFRKNFYSYIKPDLKVDGRVRGFLQKINLEDRTFSFSKDIKSITDVDFTKTIEKFDHLKNSSIQYLTHLVKD